MDLSSALLLGGLLLIVLLAAMVRGWSVNEQVAKRDAELASRRANEATDALATSRRISDAIDDNPGVDGARGWLRDFAEGSSASTDKR